MEAGQTHCSNASSWRVDYAVTSCRALLPYYILSGAVLGSNQLLSAVWFDGTTYTMHCTIMLFLTTILTTWYNALYHTSGIGASQVVICVVEPSCIRVQATAVMLRRRRISQASAANKTDHLRQTCHNIFSLDFAPHQPLCCRH